MISERDLPASAERPAWARVCPDSAFLAGGVDESGCAVDRATERAISIVDQALLAIARVERDARTGQSACRAVKIARQFQGFVGRARINGQKFPNLGKISQTRIERLQQFQPARDLKERVVLPQDRLGPCEDFRGREDGRRDVKLPALRGDRRSERAGNRTNFRRRAAGVLSARAKAATACALAQRWSYPTYRLDPVRRFAWLRQRPANPNRCISYGSPLETRVCPDR